MVSWGFILTLYMSVFAGITVAGTVLDSDSTRWLGIVGVSLGGIGLVISLKEDARKQRLGMARNPRFWCDKAVYTPPWVAWTLRLMLLALAVEIQLTFNKMAGLG